jgi:hypothetical protein
VVVAGEDPAEDAEAGLLAPAIGVAVARHDAGRFLCSPDQAEHHIAEHEGQEDLFHDQRVGFRRSGRQWGVSHAHWRPSGDSAPVALGTGRAKDMLVEILVEREADELIRLRVIESLRRVEVDG